MAELWLIRHGQAGALMGDYDQLSPLGWEQARRAGDGWRHLAPVHRVFTGQMRRHRGTAAGFAVGFGGLPAPEALAGCDEFDHQAVIRAALAAGLRPPEEGRGGAFPTFFLGAMGRWASGAHPDEVPEPFAAFQARVEGALDVAAASLGKGERGLVFTSGGVISLLVRRLLDLPLERAFELNLSLENTGFTRVRVGGGRLSLTVLNATPHLDPRAELRTLA